MSQNKFGNIWKLLNDFSFQIDNENKDIICTICKKIMINARSGPCGCRYCLACISKCLNENNNLCPGETDDCKNELIMDNLQIDNAINIKISNFNVECPKINCNYKCALKHLSDHIRVCGSGEINCLFSNIGCRQIDTVHDTMENHFKSDIVLHSKLLLECIDHLRNEFEVQKKEIREIKDENQTLKETNSKIERDNEELKNTILSLKSEEIQQKTEITLINAKLKQIEHDQARSKKLINDIRTSNSDLIKRSDNLNSTMNNVINTEINDLQIKLAEMEIKIENSENFGALEWIIENYCQQKKGINLYSKSFYSHKFGYKICISANIGEYFIVLGLCFVPGEYDDDLQWPFRHGFTLYLMNQYDNGVYESSEISYDDCRNNNGWNKPTKDINRPVTTNWIVISPKIIKEDRIIIRCKLNFRGI